MFGSSKTAQRKFGTREMKGRKLTFVKLIIMIYMVWLAAAAYLAQSDKLRTIYENQIFTELRAKIVRESILPADFTSTHIEALRDAQAKCQTSLILSRIRYWDMFVDYATFGYFLASRNIHINAKEELHCVSEALKSTITIW